MAIKIFALIELLVVIAITAILVAMLLPVLRGAMSPNEFRDGWSVEHEGEKGKTCLATSPTDRKLVLLEWFKKNQKPRYVGN